MGKMSRMMLMILMGAAVLCPAQTAPEQRPGPPGTIRVRVRLVPVDVIVTDSRDRPVTDLKQEDFQLFENGRMQEIRHFSVQTFTARPAEPDKPSVLRAIPTAELAPQASRTFLILLGRGRHQIASKAVDALIRFVRTGLLLQDRVAVFAYNRATDFTTDRERIVHVLEAYKKNQERIESVLESRLRGLVALYGSKNSPPALQADIDRIFEGARGLASRQVPPGRITETGALVREWDRAAQLILGQSDRAAETDMRKEVADETAAAGGQNSQVMQDLITVDTLIAEGLTLSLPFDEFAIRSAGTFQDLQNIFTCLEYLRYVEGEKHLLFFSERGLMFPFGNVDFDRGIAAAANDARVAIDTFHTGGIVMNSPVVTNKPARVDPWSGRPINPSPEIVSQENLSQAFTQMAMQTVSQLTGGRSAAYQDIGAALDLVNETTRVEYLLGYYPGGEDWDGKYRRINVKVNRPGVKVYFRHGYFARDTLSPLDPQEFLAYSRISAAGAYDRDINDIVFKVGTIKEGGAQPQIKVDLQIETDKVGFKTVADRHKAQLRVTIYYADGSGRHLGADWKSMDLRLQEETYRRFVQAGIPFSTTVPLKASSQILKVVVYDVGSDRVGAKLVRVR